MSARKTKNLIKTLLKLVLVVIATTALVACIDNFDGEKNSADQNYTVQLTLSNVIADESNPSSLKGNEENILKFTAREGYVFSDEIEIQNAEFTWDSSTGALTLTKITDNVVGEIKALEEFDIIYEFESDVLSLSDSKEKIIDGESLQLSLTRSDDKVGFGDVIVTVTGANYQWNASNGKLVLYNSVADVLVRFAISAEIITYPVDYVGFNQYVTIYSMPSYIIADSYLDLTIERYDSITSFDDLQFSVENAKYAWDARNGDLLIYEPTGAVTITLTTPIVPIYYNFSSNNIALVEDYNQNILSAGETKAVRLRYTNENPPSDFSCIAVDVSGASYSWNSTDGILTLSNATSNVTVAFSVETFSITYAYNMGIHSPSENADFTEFPSTIEACEHLVLQVKLASSLATYKTYTVTVDGVTSYNYDNTTGILTIDFPVGPVTITLHHIAFV